MTRSFAADRVSAICSAKRSAGVDSLSGDGSILLWDELIVHLDVGRRLDSCPATPSHWFREASLCFGAMQQFGSNWLGFGLLIISRTEFF